MHPARIFIAVFLALLVFNATAGTRITLSRFPPNPNVLPGGGWKLTPNTTFGNPPPARAWTNGVYGSVPAVVATDGLSLAGRAGNLPVSAANKVNLTDAATTIATMMLPGAVGTAARLLFDVFRVYLNDQGQLTADPGQNTEPRSVWAGENLVCKTQPTPLDAAKCDLESFKVQQNIGNNGRTYQETQAPTCSPTGVSFQWECHFHGLVIVQGGTVGSIGRDYVVSSTTGQGCGPSIDALNPANSIPAGSPVGVDGKCPTARYNHGPITAEEAAAKAAAHPEGVVPDRLRDALRDAIERGGTAPADITTSGPGSQTGTPQQSSTTNGSGTTTTTVTPQYTYNYAGDTITYTENKTTIIINPDGSSTTTTEGGQVITPQDPKDPCTANPDRAGCKDVGEPPQPEDIHKENKEVNFSPSGGFGADSGSCPGLVHTRMLGDVDVYGLFCTYMAGIRFAVVGVAWIIAAMIFIGRVET